MTKKIKTVTDENVQEEVVKYEEKLNATQASIYFKANETSRYIMLKKFKDSVLTIKEWSDLLSKEKINF